MQVVLFYANPDAEAAAEWQAMAGRMMELLSAHPGFIGVHYLKMPDGSDLAVGYFESAESIKEWYEHPEHVEAMRKGRDRIFSDYRIEVCEIVRAYTKETSLFDRLHPA